MLLFAITRHFFSLKTGENTILKPVPAGQSVNGGGKIRAAPDPNCDPTQNMCEMWLPGNYSVVLGEEKPHSLVAHILP